MKAIKNYVLVKLHRSHNDLCVKSNGGLYLNGYFNETWYTPTIGTVVSLPHTLYFKDKDFAESLEFRTKMELQAGDTVHFNYTAVENAIKKGAFWKEGDDEFVFIRYDLIFCAVRGGIETVNGWMLVSPVENQETPVTKSGLVIPGQNKYAPLVGLIKYSSSYVEKYLWEPYCDVTENGENAMRPETTIVFKKYADIDLENNMFAELPAFYRIQQKDVLATTGDRVSPSYGKIFIERTKEKSFEGSIEIPENLRKNQNTGTVIESNSFLDVGDKILFKRGAETEYQYKEKSYTILDINDVYAKLQL